MSRPQIRDKILAQLEDCLQQTQSLLISVTDTCDNQEQYFSETERWQTLSETKDQLESAVDAFEEAQRNLIDCEFPPLMPRKQKPLTTA